jgi:hypothetical protein
MEEIDIEKLKQVLPESLLPGNVGKDLTRVVWPFRYVVEFDLGDNPVINNSFTSIQQVHIGAEAGFLLLGIKRTAYENSDSGDLAPLGLRITDRQSTRQFMNDFIPIQAIANDIHSTHFESPMLFWPNALIEIELGNRWIPSGASVSTNGSGKHTFVLTGYRIRTNDLINRQQPAVGY